MRAKSNNKRISVHHIGGRSGSRAFPFLDKFEKDIVNVLYDADADCVEQIKQRNQNLGSELHVLPYCLGDTCKTTYVNINYDPYTSSLYELSPEYNLYYSFDCDHDYVLSEAAKTMERRLVEAVTIDYIFKSQDLTIPLPDFLSVDTEGSEYEILLGARETLKSNVVALVVETEFHSLHKGQKVFGDLVKLLLDLGFDFVRFIDLQELSPFRAPLGLRGEGFHTASNVLFFRRINNIEGNGDEVKRYLMLRKLSFIAIVFNQFEYALGCLRQSRNLIEYHQDTQEEEPVYLRFLRDFEQHIERMPLMYPPTFVSKYPSFMASKSRFESLADDRTQVPNKATYRMKQLLRKIPILYALLRQVKLMLNKLFPKIVFSIKSICAGYTELEALFIKYGLKTQANLLRKNRLIQTKFSAQNPKIKKKEQKK